MELINIVLALLAMWMIVKSVFFAIIHGCFYIKNILVLALKIFLNIVVVISKIQEPIALFVLEPTIEF